MIKQQKKQLIELSKIYINNCKTKEVKTMNNENDKGRQNTTINWLITIYLTPSLIHYN